MTTVLLAADAVSAKAIAIVIVGVVADICAIKGMTPDSLQAALELVIEVMTTATIHKVEQLTTIKASLARSTMLASTTTATTTWLDYSTGSDRIVTTTDRATLLAIVIRTTPTSRGPSTVPSFPMLLTTLAKCSPCLS